MKPRICLDCRRAAIRGYAHCEEHLMALLHQAYGIPDPTAPAEAVPSRPTPPGARAGRPSPEPPVSRTVALSRVDAR